MGVLGLHFVKVQVGIVELDLTIQSKYHFETQ